MITKISASIALGVVLFTATVRLQETPCLITNTPGPEACEPSCCANMTCCVTSDERTGPAAQPLAKAPSGQQNIALIATQNSVTLPVEVAKEPELFSREKSGAHSPPTLALTCIRLI